MTHGRIDYLQLPARDVARSAAFYAAVFGWSVENGSFEAPGMIGQWTTERTPSPDAGPLVWIRADNLFPTLHRVVEAGGRLCERPVPRRRRALARRGRGPGGQPDRRGRARAGAEGRRR